MAKTKQILTIKDLARYLDLHPLTITRYARQGQIPAFKINSQWRFHRKQIQKWLKAKSASSKAAKKPILDTP